MENPTLDLAVIDGIPRVSSLDIAEHFCKQHKNVLAAIHKTALECPPEFNELNFKPVEYADLKGEMRPMYQLSRDGFTLLAMGFAGKKALAWKLRYIEAFNAMEKALLEQKALIAANPKPDPLDYWDRSCDMHKRICDTSHHVLEYCSRALRDAKDALKHAERLMEETHR